MMDRKIHDISICRYIDMLMYVHITGSASPVELWLIQYLIWWLSFPFYLNPNHIYLNFVPMFEHAE